MNEHNLKQINEFPGGSKGRVNRAGDAVRQGKPSDDDLRIIEEWRAAHRAVLNTFQSILRTRTHDMDVTVAQRHKRRLTIVDKLRRIPAMQLVRMDDVAGCRLIFKDIARLYAFRQRFHKARFDHLLRNDIDKYDYIKTPKKTGYRGVHDVYEYHVRSRIGRPLAGLYVEIQYRTLVQHAWATAVEVVGFITENQPKFQKGDTRYIDAMALASEILARAHEGHKGPFPSLDDRTVVQKFLRIDKEIGLLKKLKGLSTADQALSARKNAILIFDKSGKLEIKAFRDATDALRELFELERQRPDCDMVLVRADTGEEVRLAFKNYFSDAKDFIQLVEDACQTLAHARLVTAKKISIKSESSMKKA